MGRLAGTHVVVIAAPLALELAAQGAAVVVADPDAEVVASVVAAVRAAGGRAHGWVGSPSDAGVAEMAAELFPDTRPPV